MLKALAVVALCCSAFKAGAQTLIEKPRIPAALRSPGDGLNGTVEQRAQMVVAVAFYRREIMGDTARMEMCGLRKFVPDTVLIGENERRRFGGVQIIRRTGIPCDSVQAGTYPYQFSSRVIVVDSSDVTDKGAKVWCTVRSGETLHREEFTLLTNDRHFSVISARLFGLLQAR